MTYNVTVLPGDGIGPEVTAQAVLALKKAADIHGFSVDIHEAAIGGAAVDSAGEPLPEETVARCRASDAVLLGAVGGPKWDSQPTENRPEAGLDSMRLRFSA